MQIPHCFILPILLYFKIKYVNHQIGSHKMFEGKKDDPVNKTTWIPESFTRALEEYAASQNILLNRRIIQYCQYAMAHRKKDGSLSQN